MTETVGTFRIDRRYCGPPNSGNGGYVSGLLAQFIDGSARARLVAPVPLESEIRVVRDGAGVIALAGDTKVGLAEPAAVEITLPEIPDAASVAAARAAYDVEARTHPLPHCFVCGPKRDPGDALCLFTGPVPGSPVNADVWDTHADFADADGLIRSEILWSALDCPTAFALRHGDTKLCLLGSLTAEIYRRPKAGERLIVMAWKRGIDGRKNYGDGALVDEQGDVVAAANAVWIELTDPKVIAAVKAG